MQNTFSFCIVGSLQSSFYMAANDHVTDRLKNKIDRATSAMMENGLHQFYKSFTAYLTEMRAQKLKRTEDDELHALTIDDLKGPLIFCSYLLSFILFVFFIEVIIRKFNIQI